MARNSCQPDTLPSCWERRDPSILLVIDRRSTGMGHTAWMYPKKKNQIPPAPRRSPALKNSFRWAQRGIDRPLKTCSDRDPVQAFPSLNLAKQNSLARTASLAAPSPRRRLPHTPAAEGRQGGPPVPPGPAAARPPGRPAGFGARRSPFAPGRLPAGSRPAPGRLPAGSRAVPGRLVAPAWARGGRGRCPPAAAATLSLALRHRRSAGPTVPYLRPRPKEGGMSARGWEAQTDPRMR